MVVYVNPIYFPSPSSQPTPSSPSTPSIAVSPSTGPPAKKDHTAGIVIGTLIAVLAVVGLIGGYIYYKRSRGPAYTSIPDHH